MEDLVVLDIFQVYHIFEHDLGLTPTLSEQVFDTNYDGIDAKLENNMFMHKSETVFHWDQKTCKFEIYDCLVGTRDNFQLLPKAIGFANYAKSIDQMKQIIESIKNELKDYMVFFHNMDLTDTLSTLD